MRGADEGYCASNEQQWTPMRFTNNQAECHLLLHRTVSTITGHSSFTTGWRPIRAEPIASRSTARRFAVEVGHVHQPPDGRADESTAVDDRATEPSRSLATYGRTVARAQADPSPLQRPCGARTGGVPGSEPSGGEAHGLYFRTTSLTEAPAAPNVCATASGETTRAGRDLGRVRPDAH
jgi:hypothetical protein